MISRRPRSRRFRCRIARQANPLRNISDRETRVHDGLHIPRVHGIAARIKGTGVHRIQSAGPGLVRNELLPMGTFADVFISHRTTGIARARMAGCIPYLDHAGGICRENESLQSSAHSRRKIQRASARGTEKPLHGRIPRHSSHHHTASNNARAEHLCELTREIRHPIVRSGRGGALYFEICGAAGCDQDEQNEPGDQERKLASEGQFHSGIDAESGRAVSRASQWLERHSRLGTVKRAHPRCKVRGRPVSEHVAQAQASISCCTIRSRNDVAVARAAVRRLSPSPWMFGPTKRKL